MKKENISCKFWHRLHIAARTLSLGELLITVGSCKYFNRWLKYFIYFICYLCIQLYSTWIFWNLYFFKYAILIHPMNTVRQYCVNHLRIVDWNKHKSRPPHNIPITITIVWHWFLTCTIPRNISAHLQAGQNLCWSTKRNSTTLHI